MIVINNYFNLSIIKKLIKLFYLHCSCKKVVEESNKENLKVIKNTLPNKWGNPESLKNYSKVLQSSSNNMHIVSEDLLRAFWKLVFLRFCISSDQWKSTMQQRFHKEFEGDFYTKIIVTIFPTNLVRNSLLSLVCPFVEIKKKNQIFGKLVIW